jgi:hypothetical protein
MENFQAVFESAKALSAFTFDDFKSAVKRLLSCGFFTVQHHTVHKFGNDHVLINRIW